MPEKTIKNTHPNNLGILQFWILPFDFCILELANCSQSRNYLPPLFS